MRMPSAAARTTDVESSGSHGPAGVRLESSAMNPRLSQPQASPTRNPVARSLALAVLGVALLGAAIMGAIGFVLLLCVSAIGYIVSLGHSSWRRWLRPRRRAASIAESAAAPANAGSIEGELEVGAAAANVASRGSSGPA
jgi:hypothetical protein